MASQKKQRKRASVGRKSATLRSATQRDGDRRRRGSADEAVAAKQRAHDWNIDEGGFDVLSRPASAEAPDRPNGRDRD